MADAITIKALQDASLDAKSLEEVVNGDEAKQVTTRKGETYPSVKKAIKTMFENGGLPATPFETKALMTASALVDGDYAMVTHDSVASNNGLYVKTAGSWVNSTYSINKKDLYVYKSSIPAGTTELSSIVETGIYFISQEAAANLTDVPTGYSYESKTSFLFVERFDRVVRQTLQRVAYINSSSDTKRERVVTVTSAGVAIGVAPWESAHRESFDRGVHSVLNSSISSLTMEGQYVLTNLTRATDSQPWFPSSGFMVVTKFGDFIKQDIFNAVNFNDPVYSTRILRPSRDEVFEWNIHGAEDSDSQFTNEKIVFLGDSITASGAYAVNAASILNAEPVVVGVGGARLTEAYSSYGQSGLSGVDFANAINTEDYSVLEASPTYTSNKSKVDAIKNLDWDTVDYLVIFYGTNDYAAGVPLGETDTIDRGTIRGAINYVTQQILTKHKHIKLFFVTPMYRSRIVRDDGQNSLEYPNKEGIYNAEYAKAITEESARLGIPSVDLTKICSINNYNSTRYLTDGLHPNPLGHALIGGKLASALRSNF